MSAKLDQSGPVWWWPFLRRSPREDTDDLPSCRLALQLHNDLPRPDHSRSVLLSTPVASHCCVYGGMSLAYCLAKELQQPVLLIDGCPARPQFSQMIDCAVCRGFSDLLSDPHLTIEECVLATSQRNLSFIAAGTQTGASVAAAADGVHRLLQAAESQYDFVVLVGGSVLHDPTVLTLVPHVGCVLLLAVEAESRVEDLDAAQHSLSFCRPRKLELVLVRYGRGGVSRGRALAASAMGSTS